MADLSWSHELKWSIQSSPVFISLISSHVTSFHPNLLLCEAIQFVVAATNQNGVGRAVSTGSATYFVLVGELGRFTSQPFQIK